MKLHESDSNRGGIIVKLIQRALAHIYIYIYPGSLLTLCILFWKGYSVWCNLTSTNEEKVLIGRIYKNPNSTEKNTQELLKLMKSDLLNNYDKIYIVGDLSDSSVRWDGE